MLRRIRSVALAVVLAGLIVVGSVLSGYSGTESEKPSGVGTQQPETTYRPFKDSLRWRAGLEVIADLKVSPETHSGVCPAIFTFKGSIYSNKAMTLQYRFIRSDNVRTSPIPLALGKDERKEVTYTWQFGDSAGPAEFREWVLLQVIYPTNMKAQSNTVLVKGSCTNHDGTKQNDLSGKQQSQEGPPGAPPVVKGPIPLQFPVPPPQSGQEAGSMPMIQPGQTGQRRGGMPMPQPGPKELMPGESPMMPGSGKGQVPSSMPMPQPNIKELFGPEK